MVAHLFSIVFICIVAYFAVPGSSLFSWHPFLMSLGYVGFMFQAILVFSKESSLFVNMAHKTKVTLHWIFNSLGMVSVLAGFGVIYYNKELRMKEHITTWHGKIGLFTIVYTAVQYLFGHNLTILNSFVAKMTKLSYPQRAIFHATSGTLLFVSICCSICLGINSTWFSEATPFYTWYFAFAATGLFGLIVTNQVTAKYVKPKVAEASNFKMPEMTRAEKLKANKVAKKEAKKIN